MLQAGGRGDGWAREHVRQAVRSVGANSTRQHTPGAASRRHAVGARQAGRARRARAGRGQPAGSARAAAPRLVLSVSRSLNTLSRLILPSSLRIVVCASCVTAYIAFSTPYEARKASTTWRGRAGASGGEVWHGCVGQFASSVRGAEGVHHLARAGAGVGGARRGCVGGRGSLHTAACEAREASTACVVKHGTSVSLLRVACKPRLAAPSWQRQPPAAAGSSSRPARPAHLDVQHAVNGERHVVLGDGGLAALDAG